jgi:hypothetical protein
MKLEIEITMDGDKWCALYGENLQEGCAGFGETPIEALRSLVDDLEQTRGSHL